MRPRHYMIEERRLNLTATTVDGLITQAWEQVEIPANIPTNGRDDLRQAIAVELCKAQSQIESADNRPAYVATVTEHALKRALRALKRALKSAPTPVDPATLDQLSRNQWERNPSRPQHRGLRGFVRKW